MPRNLRVARLRAQDKTKVKRNAFTSEPPPSFPETTAGPGNHGPTPNVPKMGAIKTNAHTRLKKDYTDRMLLMEMHDGIVYGKRVPYQRLFDKIFPEDFIPVSIEEIFKTLRAHVLEKHPEFTIRNWWKRWLALLEMDDYKNTKEDEKISEQEAVTGQPPATDDKKQESREEKLSKLLTRIADKICELFPQLIPFRRRWTSYFHTKPVKTKGSKMPRKPDVVAVDMDERVEDSSKRGRMGAEKIKVLAEEKKAAYKGDRKFVQVVGVDMYNKSYVVFEHQEDRRFVLGFGMTDTIFRLSVMDRGGAIHSKGFDIYNDPKAFLHAFVGMTFAPDEYIGIDTSIGTNEDGSRFVVIDGIKYNIIDTVWRIPMIRGRATTCWLAKIDGTDEEVIIKDYWIVVGREPTEVFFLKEAEGNDVEGIPELFDWENVVIGGRLDTTDNNRGVHYPLLNRLHRRMVFKKPSDAISFFESKRELLSILRDIVICLRDLYLKANILHRDISLFNIMIGKDRNSDGYRKGVLIDYDYALDLLKRNILSPVSPEIWPRSLRKQADPNSHVTEEELSADERATQRRILECLEAGLRIRGHRTGTRAFMAHQILVDPLQKHIPEFDLQSVFYIIIYMCVIQTGPNGEEKTEGQIPEFLWNWLHPESVSAESLGSNKLGMINYSDIAFKNIVTDSFSPYMKDFIPCVKEMKEALRTGNVTHEVWIDILTRALQNMPVEAKYDYNVPKVTTGVWQNTRSRIRQSKLEAEKSGAAPTGYVSADPNLMTTIEHLPLAPVDPAIASTPQPIPGSSKFTFEDSPFQDIDLSAFLNSPLAEKSDVDDLPLPALRISDNLSDDSEDDTVVGNPPSQNSDPKDTFSQFTDKGKGKSRDDTRGSKFESRLRAPSVFRKVDYQGEDDNTQSEEMYIGKAGSGSRTTKIEENETRKTEKRVTSDTVLPLSSTNKTSTVSTTTVSSSTTTKKEVLSLDESGAEQSVPTKIPRIRNARNNAGANTKGSRNVSN